MSVRIKLIKLLISIKLTKYHFVKSPFIKTDLDNIFFSNPLLIESNIILFYYIFALKGYFKGLLYFSYSHIL